jgi:UDP-3-O-[3-hydroxymyristoyl] glucosamine N-acyltransferase
VTRLLFIGAGKFALEVARYAEDSGFEIEHYLAIEGEEVHAPDGKWSKLAEYEPAKGAEVVLAVSDMAQRRELIDGYITPRGLAAVNVVHPSSRVDPAAIEGLGNIIGPDNYVGVNVVIGSYNVINYRCTVGNHSRIGSANFLSPNFHSGNSVELGDWNFFGLDCTVAPEVSIGDECRFQAGLTLFEDAASGFSYIAPSRIKSIKSLQS